MHCCDSVPPIAPVKLATANFLEDKFVDQKDNTWSRLGGSVTDKGIIAVRVHPDGHVRVLLSVNSEERDDKYCGRFEQAIKV